jgi:hypothetical protein
MSTTEEKITAYQIRQNIIEEQRNDYAEILGSGDDIGEVMERAEGWLPVYHHQILEAWTVMPNDFTDSWREMGEDNRNGIFQLMTMDLATWYCDMAREEWDNLKTERGDN